MKFFVDPDIRKAETLDTSFYNSRENFEISKKKIFSSTWQYIGDKNLVRLQGQLSPKLFLEGFCNDPILFVRDKEDHVHCLSNVCTHRGNILVDAACTASHIRCRYHGRKFKLNGDFSSMPEFEGVENFPSEKDNLSQVPFSQWEQFLFASIDAKISAGDVLGDMKKRMSFLPLTEFSHHEILSRDYVVKANWALYCENYLEGFHIPYVHQSLAAVLDYNSYSTELFPYSVLQLGLSRGGDEIFELPKDHPDHGKKIAAYYWWIFPNLMFNFYPWGLSINIVRPLAPDLTKVSFITYTWKENKPDRGAGADLDKVEREDESIVEDVQKGIRSSFYKNGRYSPARETGTHHFHRLICEFMNS
ncbi:MAG: Rieske 2Fe-2S domain-containing protein [Bacteroidetes bacterium]|nr:Rieske 2Fe-2S domain-containing protein [Bacteroidota bacterium]